jgi:hypothetical protein
LSENSEGHPQRLSLLDFMAVGRKGIRFIDLENIKMEKSKDRIVITLSTLEYGPGDTINCPSRESKAIFIIAPELRSRLKEIKKEKGTYR